jgi:hypothetical protein
VTSTVPAQAPDSRDIESGVSADLTDPAERRMLRRRPDYITLAPLLAEIERLP